MSSKNIFIEKLREALSSVLPITLIVAVMCLTFVPVGNDLMLSFVIGSVMLTAGMGLFTLGADMSMTRIGNLIGTEMTKSRKLWLILLISFALGFVVTMAEPDLQVLAANVPAIDKSVLVFTVAAGVGLFLVICMLRIFFAVQLRWILLGAYTIVFILSAFTSKSFLSVAFDSGGVTTGPMTVPFIMALGVGVAAIRSDENAKEDSFGLIALCSVGPVIAVMLLSFIFGESSGESGMLVANFDDTVALGRGYVGMIPHYASEVASALAPIFGIFILFQIISLRLRRMPFIRIIMGIIFTYAGLVMFLTGANVGFSSLGYVIGGELVSGRFRLLLIPLAMLMGWFIINAEPAVHVLNKQVEELSAGAISAKAMGLSLSVAVSAANGLAMVRVITGISIMYFLVPGYVIALALSFFVPRTFTAIAFDSGGVASGPLTAAFMLPFAMGACSEMGGNIMTDAFGLVALVAMMPLITVQIMGAIAVIKSKYAKEEAVVPVYGDDEVIELWEC